MMRHRNTGLIKKRANCLKCNERQAGQGRVYLRRASPRRVCSRRALQSPQEVTALHRRPNTTRSRQKMKQSKANMKKMMRAGDGPRESRPRRFEAGEPWKRRRRLGRSAAKFSRSTVLHTSKMFFTSISGPFILVDSILPNKEGIGVSKAAHKSWMKARIVRCASIPGTGTRTDSSARCWCAAPGTSFPLRQI